MAGIYMSDGSVLAFAAPISVISNKPVFAMDTMNLQRTTYGNPAQRWEIKTNLVPTNDSAEFFVHSVLNNFDSVFDIQMPQVYRGKNYQKNSVSMTASGAAGSTQVSVSGSGLLKGEFVRFVGHNKTYMIASNQTSGTVTVFPRLKKAVSGEMQRGDNVHFRATYDSTNVVGMIYVDGVLMDPGSLTFIEDIS
jgi:hypothetical protein